MDLLYDKLNNKLIKKEKSYVVDYCRNFGNLVAARLFRSKYKSKFPANRQLDPYFDRYRRHTRRFEPAGDRINSRFGENVRGSQTDCLASYKIKEKRIVMMKCSDVMTKNLVCCLPSDLVIKAAGLMKSENIGSILVIDNAQSQKLVGIVTDRDLALKIVAEGLGAKSTNVETVMTRNVVTCLVGDDLQKALDAMGEHQLRRIPVVDNNNKVLGIIAQADVATRLDQPEKTAEMVKEISKANGK